jgi:plastocyanin
MWTLIVVNRIPGRDLPMLKLRNAFRAACLLYAAGASAGPLELRVLKIDGSPASATVMLLRSTDAARSLAKPVDATMGQVDLQFVPHVLIVPTGSRIVFPNTDTVRHQVYSFSPIHRFELPLYRGTPRPEVFDRAGVVTVGCNIHDSMRAYVFVVEAQYFGRADVAGIWKAGDVQPGTYTVQVWHPLSRDMRPVIEQKITVTAGESRQTLHIALPLKLRLESQIPANWDAY